MFLKSHWENEFCDLIFPKFHEYLLKLFLTVIDYEMQLDKYEKMLTASEVKRKERATT